jgi:hypothetical protein
MFEWNSIEQFWIVGVLLELRETVDWKMNSKVIWSYWHDDLESAPALVRVCHESWTINNPGWRVVLVSNKTLSSYISASELLPTWMYPSIQKFANHVRLLLLKKYGGVWADADLLCLQPLDGWIHKAATRGLFMFTSPSTHKPIANWFIFNSAQDPLGQKALEEIECSYRDYFENNRFRRGRLAVSFAFLVESGMTKLMNSVSLAPHFMSRIWLSRLATKVLRLTPYFAFHYIVNSLLDKKPESVLALIEMQKISAAGPLAMRWKLQKTDVSEIRQPWFPEDLMVSKLNYRALSDENMHKWITKISL